jgi:glycosyltransferase involved in cell wall biosynthesis
MPALEKENILILSTTFWDDLQFRRQIFAGLFSNSNKVLYVNPLYGVLSFVRDEDARRNYFGFLKGIQTITPLLGVVTLPPLFPFSRTYNFIGKVNRIISAFLLNLVTRFYFGTEQFVEIAYLPEDTYWTPHKRSKCLVYDCVDEHSEYPFRNKNKDRAKKLEIELLRKADIVFVTGQELLKKKSKVNANTHVIPNGVDFALFSGNGNDEAIDPEVAKLQGIVILYIGGIFEWFDLALVHSLAEQRPHWNIVLVGPTNYAKTKLQKYKNIIYVGKKRKEILPQYLHRSKVCLIPFVLNDLTHHVNPLKLYEYWAAGKPVVSVAMKELLPLQAEHILEFAVTSQDFIEKIEKMIAANSETIEESRRTLAQKYSWPLLFKEYSSLISQQLKKHEI